MRDRIREGWFHRDQYIVKGGGRADRCWVAGGKFKRCNLRLTLIRPILIHNFYHKCSSR